MKLYNLEAHKNIKLYVKDKIIIFDHIDGLYSYCWLEEDRNKIVRISALVKLRKYRNGYKVVE